MSIKSCELNKFGFVQDFGDFKPIREWVDQNLDHAMLINQDDEAMLLWLKANNQRHFVFESNPTSEHLARFLYDKACGLGLRLCAVEVDETCTSTARYVED